MGKSVNQLVKSQPQGLSSIQELVKEDLDLVATELHRIVVSDFELIDQVNEHLFLTRGKLFRPTLVLLSSRVGGEASDEALTLAAVVELVHLATLVHDDAVDHSVLRRGLPTVNASWTHQVAIIMGDYLYSRGVTELAKLGNLPALEVLAQAANEMAVGEMRQLMSYDALSFGEDDYYRLIGSKTASLMSAACAMGALAGIPSYQSRLAKYGNHLGMAFQIADDLLDYTACETITGKPSGQDLREHKVTLPLVGALANTTEGEHRHIRSFFDTANPSDEDISRIIGIVEERGGLEYARVHADRCAQMAQSSLLGLSEDPALSALSDAVSWVVDRQR